MPSSAKVKVLVAQLCLTLCNPMDFSPPGSAVNGIFQARMLEWAAISSSRGSSWPRDLTYVSHIAGWFFTVWASNNDSESETCSVSNSLWPHGLILQARILDWGSLSLLQGIFPTQRSNPSLLHCRWILYQLSHKGSPRILEWVAYPFSSGYSRPKNQSGVPCISGGFFTNWATAVLTFVNHLTIYEWIYFCNVYSAVVLFILEPNLWSFHFCSFKVNLEIW